MAVYVLQPVKAKPTKKIHARRIAGRSLIGQPKTAASGNQVSKGHAAGHELARRTRETCKGFLTSLRRRHEQDRGGHCKRAGDGAADDRKSLGLFTAVRCRR